jgi:murein DD-endopeptidase MepM/ murein hydrolase activator NlpD
MKREQISDDKADQQPSSKVARRRFLQLGGAATLAVASAGAADWLWPERAAAAVGAMHWPVTGTVNSLIGPRNGRPHDGIDIGAPQGREVYAAYGGTVTQRVEVGYGNYVDIGHPNGWMTRYAHLSKFVAANGAAVVQGQLIGRVGSTGNSTGPHLHFEARRGPDPYTNLNTAAGPVGSSIQAREPIGIDFPGLGPSPSTPAPYDSYFRGIAAQPPSGSGYWLITRDGGVFSFDADFFGSMGGSSLAQPVVGMAAHPSGNGYWLVAADGGIFTFARQGSPVPKFHGSMGGRRLNAPIVGMAAHPSGNGYWLVGADGGIFAFPEGGLPFYGSMGSKHLNEPMVGMAATPSGNGYWLVAGDGGIFNYGDARFVDSGVKYDRD